MTLLLAAPSAALAEAPAGKILPGHRDRLAVVYVRQSTAQQVSEHRESTRLQYGLTERARALGWAADRVLVIDDDLGRSGARREDRAGFQRLVAEVSLGHVGLILGLEMSRLARSNTDWYQLLELCALFRTLLADTDGVYDPTQYNDRLLLGLKGTLSEAELHVLKQRMHQGRLSKARRGELRFALPIGYVWGPDGAIQLDPDEQVRAVVRLVFRKFEELGTLHGVLRYLARHEIRLGVRVREGPGKGELVWRRPNRMTLQNLLKHPLYAGAYVYGRRQEDPRRHQPHRPRSGRVVVDPSAWLACVPDRAPAYISWPQYEAHRAQLAANRARTASRGAARPGPTLLAGLVGCARCGARLLVRYDSPPARAVYVCQRRATDYGAPQCQQVAARPLDAFVAGQVLAALEPAALELSLAAAEHIEAERADLARLWEQRRERAAYEAERARRQYDAVEPEHRLVARTLERQWEAKLAAREHLEEEYRRFRRARPRTLTADERAAIRQLAADVPALWAAPSTTAADRKELVRQVVERVVVDAAGASERVRVTIHWIGGRQTGGTVLRPIRHSHDLHRYAEICERIRALTEEGLPAHEIAAQLTAAGYRPARGGAFGVQTVRSLRQRLGVTGARPRRRARTGGGARTLRRRWGSPSTPWNTGSTAAGSGRARRPPAGSAGSRGRTPPNRSGSAVSTSARSRPTSAGSGSNERSDPMPHPLDQNALDRGSLAGSLSAPSPGRRAPAAWPATTSACPRPWPGCTSWPSPASSGTGSSPCSGGSHSSAVPNTL
jgi:DNA invertase Pin-like site-specific DNA recombinase